MTGLERLPARAGAHVPGQKEPALTTVLLLIHLFVTLALIGVVLIQRSEGGGLGVGTSQGMGSFMSGRGTANLLTRATAILATIFMVLSLTLALLNRGTSGMGRSILDVPSGPSGSVVPGSPGAVPAVPGTATTGIPSDGGAAGSSGAGGTLGGGTGSPPSGGTGTPPSGGTGSPPSSGAGGGAGSGAASPGGTSAPGPSVPTN